MVAQLYLCTARPGYSSRDNASPNIPGQRLFVVGQLVAQQGKFVPGLFVAVLIMRQHLNLYRASEKSTEAKY